MRKKIAAAFFLFLAMIAMFNFRYYNNDLVLKNVGYGYKIYQTASSSNIKEIKGLNFCCSVKSESCYIDKKGFNILDFLNKNNAKLVFTEQIESGCIYYAFSPTIKYMEKVKNEKINLQIFVGKNTIKAGAPLIYESF